MVLKRVKRMSVGLAMLLASVGGVGLDSLAGTVGGNEAGPVVFFVTTSRFEEPGGIERICRYASAGHLIANHSHSHRWLRETDSVDYIEDRLMAESLLEDFENRRPWYRFPFLDV